MAICNYNVFMIVDIIILPSFDRGGHKLVVISFCMYTYTIEKTAAGYTCTCTYSCDVVL